MVVEISLQKLDLLGVNVSEPTLNEIINSCPHLENLRFYGACLFSHIHVGGQGINLKHFKLVDCEEAESIFLYDFDLVSFQYIGPEIELHITDLPKLKELDIGRVSVGLENNVFHQIESCASYLQVLYLETKDCPEEGLIASAIPKLPNVKKLYLTIGAEEDDCLLEFTAIAQACPSLETLEFSLTWSSPIKKRRKIRHVAAHPHEHLKLLKFNGYYGRISDLELLAYVIENAVDLRKIVIDPCCHAYGEDLTAEDLLKREQAARSCAKRQITSILPRGVELAICSVGVCGLYV